MFPPRSSPASARRASLGGGGFLQDAYRRAANRANRPSQANTGAMVFDEDTGDWVSHGRTNQVNTKYGQVAVDPYAVFDGSVSNDPFAGIDGQTGTRTTRTSTSTTPQTNRREGVPLSELSQIDAFLGTQPKVSRIAGPSADQEQQARNSAIVRAKQRAYQQGSAALNSLYGRLQARGMGGGGYEAGEIGEVLAQAANPVGDLLVQQSQDDVNQARHVADQEFQGDITQRGQDQARRLAMLQYILGRNGLERLVPAEQLY